MRSALRHRAPAAAQGITKVGAISIDLLAHRVEKNGTEIRLTRKEFAVLAELARYPGRVITHNHLLRAIWGEAHIGDTEYLRVAVRSLRLKLEDDPAAPVLIQNEPGIGYRLN